MAHNSFYAVLMPEQHRALNPFRKVADFSSYKTGRRDLINQQKKARSCLQACVFLVVSLQEEDTDEDIQLCILSRRARKNFLETHTQDAKESEAKNSIPIS